MFHDAAIGYEAVEESSTATFFGFIRSRPLRMQPPPRKKSCSKCGRQGHDRRRCLLPDSQTFDPWLDLEWEEHVECQKIVAEHPDGMTLEEVGEVLGVTRERVRQIESAALRKLRSGLGLGGTADYDGQTFALIDCEKCGEPFIRQGRGKVCEGCLPPPAPRPKRVKASGPDFTLGLFFIDFTADA